MQPVIVLTREAVDAMFPPGTEARIKLSEEAIRALVDEGVKASGVSNEASTFLRIHKDSVVSEVLKDYGTNTLSIGRNFVLNQRTVDAITTAVHKTVAGQIEQCVEAQMKRLLSPESDCRIEHNLFAETNRLIHRIAREEAQKQLEGFTSKLQNLIKG